MYGILCKTNQEQKEWVLLNVDCFIMECGLIYIGKRTMICLQCILLKMFLGGNKCLLLWLPRNR